MELKEFVTQTIISINQGITDAQEQTKDSGIIINPKNFKKKGINDYEPFEGNPTQVQDIEFNIVVNVTEGNDSKIAVGVFSGILSGGTSNTNQNNNSTQTTIKFSVPVQFPSDDELKPHRPIVF